MVHFLVWLRDWNNARHVHHNCVFRKQKPMTEREILAAWLGLVIGFVWGLLCAIAGYLTFY